MAVVGLTQPSPKWKSITPDDNNDLPDGACRGIYIGSSGNVNMTDCYGNTMIFYSVQPGTVLAIQAKRVLASNTSATHLIALY